MPEFANSELDCELVLAISRTIIQREVEADKSIVLNLIRSALLAVSDRERITMKVHPSDLEFAREHKKEILEGIEGVEKLICEGDEDFISIDYITIISLSRFSL